MMSQKSWMKRRNNKTDPDPPQADRMTEKTLNSSLLTLNYSVSDFPNPLLPFHHIQKFPVSCGDELVWSVP